MAAVRPAPHCRVPRGVSIVAGIVGGDHCFTRAARGCVDAPAPTKKGGHDATLLAGVSANGKIQHKTNLRSALASNWAAKHSLVSGVIGVDPQVENKRSTCQVFGMCVCRGRGKLVYRLRNRFLAVLKIRFPQAAPARKSVLKASCVVARLQTCVICEDRAAEVWQDGPLLHIGAMYLNPWRPTYRMCELVFEDTAQAQARMRIKGLDDCRVERRVFNHMNTALDVRWRVRVYVLCERDGIVLPFDPTFAECVRYRDDDVDGQEFWPPPKAKRGKRKKRPADSDDQDEEADAVEEVDELAILGAAAEPEEESDEAALVEHAMALEAARLADMEAAEAEALVDVMPGEDEDVPGARSSSGSSSDSSSSSSRSSSSSSSSSASEGVDSDDVSSAPPPAGDKRRDCMVVLSGGGVIRWYGNGENFAATCPNPAHGKCVMTRASCGHAFIAARYPHQGRPVGMLAAWLANSGVPSKKDHWEKADMPSLSAREAARAELKTSRAGRRILRRERSPRPGEPEEPAGLA